jgi:hypothetical protein
MSTRWHICPRREFLMLAGGLLAVTTAAALLTGLLFPGQARAVLAVHFVRIPATSGQALAIWLHNARVVIGVGVFAAARHVSRAFVDDAFAVWDRAIVALCDGMLGLWAVGSSLTAGVLLGAYGTRQLEAFLPDGPVEVAAWLLLLVLYLDVRQGRATASQTTSQLGVVLTVLGVAALLELWAGG